MAFTTPSADHKTTATTAAATSSKATYYANKVAKEKAIFSAFVAAKNTHWTNTICTAHTDEFPSHGKHAFCVILDGAVVAFTDADLSLT